MLFDGVIVMYGHVYVLKENPTIYLTFYSPSAEVICGGIHGPAAGKTGKLWDGRYVRKAVRDKYLKSKQHTPQNYRKLPFNLIIHIRHPGICLYKVST